MLRHRDPLADPEPLIRRVYSYAAYRLGDGPDAEDATSETFARAVRYRQAFDGRAGTPQAWLLGIARRVIDDHLSRAGRLELNGEPSVEGAEDFGPAAIERLSLRTALAQLSRDERDLLAMRYGGDLTARDIARITDTRVNTVEVALHRALVKLRERMQERTLT
jgi:RNA polymerase sigma-70 factor (ECF subfamily)